MLSLEKLEVQFSSNVEPLLEIDGLKELILHVPEQYCSSCMDDWIRNGPIHFNLLLQLRLDKGSETDVETCFFISILLMNFSPLSDCTSHFKLYHKLRPPLDLFPTLPDFQMEIGLGQNYHTICNI